MTIKSFVAEAWMQIAGLGLVVLLAVMMIAPFVESVITNIGRRAPSTAWRNAASRRMLAAPRRAVS